MAKIKTRYICQACGSAQPKWMGRCPDCGEWNTLVETLVEASKGATATPAARQALMERNPPQPLTDISADSYQRTL